MYLLSVRVSCFCCLIGSLIHLCCLLESHTPAVCFRLLHKLSAIVSCFPCIRVLLSVRVSCFCSLIGSLIHLCCLLESPTPAVCFRLLHKLSAIVSCFPCIHVFAVCTCFLFLLSVRESHTLMLSVRVTHTCCLFQAPA